MAGPDLTAAAARVEALMDDECVITRDPEQGGDDVLNEATGQMVSPVPDVIKVYRGRCMFRVLTQGSDRNAVEGGAVKVLTRYRFSIPLVGPELKTGDVVEITASRRDPIAVGKRLRITDPLVKTFAVSRVAICEQRESVSDRP